MSARPLRGWDEELTSSQISVLLLQRGRRLLPVLQRERRAPYSLSRPGPSEIIEAGGPLAVAPAVSGIVHVMYRRQPLEAGQLLRCLNRQHWASAAH